MHKQTPHHPPIRINSEDCRVLHISSNSTILSQKLISFSSSRYLDIVMGNYVSCTLSGPRGSSKHSKATKVIFPTGEIRQIYEPIKAAELMLDSPNFFLVNSNSLQMGRRFSALNADEDLEIASVYLLFPMKRVNSMVTAADMGALFLTAKRVSIGNARILPEIVPAPVKSCEQVVTKLNLEDIEEFSLPEYKHRMSMCRSKKPLLETIAEEPVCSR